MIWTMRLSETYRTRIARPAEAPAARKRAGLSKPEERWTHLLLLYALAPKLLSQHDPEGQYRFDVPYPDRSGWRAFCSGRQPC